MKSVLIKVASLLVCSGLILLSGCGGGGGGGNEGDDGDDGKDPLPAPVFSGTWRTAQMIENASGHAEDPQVAFDAKGNAMAVWAQRDSMRFSIWANYYTPGIGWGVPELVEFDNTGDAKFPQVAFDANGNAMVIWEQSIGGGNYSIYANRYAAAARTWDMPTLLESDDSGEAYNAQIAIDANGNAIAVWQQDVGGVYSIFANRYTAATGTWGNAQLLENDDTDNAANPQIAIDAKGNALAVWTQENGADIISAYANRFTAGAWQGAQLLEATDEDVDGPKIAFDADGNAIAIWSQADGIRYSIYSKRYTAGAWQGLELVETDGGGDAYRPAIAIDADGNAIAVWQYDEDLGGGMARSSIRSSRYVAGKWTPSQPLETNDTDDAYNPHIAFDGSGNAITVWGQVGAASNSIWFNRYQAGSGWGSAQRLETVDDSDLSSPQIAVNSKGNALAVWMQGGLGSQSIWAASYE